MGSLDSGHTTVKTDNSQPGLSQGQDPSSRALKRTLSASAEYSGGCSGDSDPPTRGPAASRHPGIGSGRGASSAPHFTLRRSVPLTEWPIGPTRMSSLYESYPRVE
jgi:hypothetical protein